MPIFFIFIKKTIDFLFIICYYIYKINKGDKKIMTFILNKCYGGWSISDFAKEQLGLNSNYPDMDEVDEKKLAELINKYGPEKCSGLSAWLKVVEIPDNATDWDIDEYDGIERIVYVIDGKLNYA